MFTNRLIRIFQFSEIISLLGFLLVFSNKSSAINPNCFFQLNVLPERTYYVTSPNYPNMYTGENYCQWNIKSSFQIHLNCEVFVIPPSYNCQLDHVLLNLNPGINAPLRLCGNGSLIRDSEGHEMTITLQSNYDTPGGGFACYLQVIDTEENCRCGWKKPTRIVGGENTGVNEYTMMAGIVDAKLVQVFCGGVIISKKHVLTAAHCIKQKEVSEIGVIIGDHDLSTGTDANATLLRAINIIMHPSFVPNIRNSDFDIAVITVENSIHFTNEIGPACLPFQHNHDSFSGSFVDLLGWGTIELAGPSSNILQKVRVSVINLSKCLRTYPKIIDHQLCTLTEGKDACQFDSGGPVLWQNPTTKRLVIVGIIIYGIACGTKIPSVNTRVGAFIEWIESVTEGADYCKAE